MQEQTRPEVTGDETTVVEMEPEGHPDSPVRQAETTKPEDNPPTRYLCADGCGRVVSKEGGYARGHNPNSKANATTARAAQAKRRNGGPSLFKQNPDQFTIDEVMTIANYGGSGGLIEVSKLRDGLVMVLRLRGER